MKENIQKRKSDDVQMEKQREFPLVDSTPSMEGVQLKTFSKALHRFHKNNTQPEMTNLVLRVIICRYLEHSQDGE